MEGMAWGGSEELWSQAALRLAAAGHSVRANVAHWEPLSPRVTALEAGGCPIATRRIGRSLKAKAKVRQLVGQGYKPPQRLLLERWLAEVSDEQVVISQGANYDALSVLAMEICAERGIPYSIVTQANSLVWWPEDAIVDHLAGLFQGARRAFFVSRGNSELFERQFGVELSNSLVISNPFTVSFDQPFGWPDDDGVVRLACVARMEPSAKSQDVILQTLALDHWRERADRLRVSFFGNGPWEKGIRRFATQLNLKNVEFPGFIDGISKVWERHHALLLPSRHEGLPLALIEAMLCGRAALVTDVPGNAELVEDGKTGFVIDAPSVAALDAGLERLWADRHRLREMGMAAGESVRRQVPRDPVGKFVEHLLT
jgi:glycosyltransferase involved in cell wall biosynthesis